MRNIGKRQPRPLLLPDEKTTAPTMRAEDSSRHVAVVRMLTASTAHIHPRDSDFLDDSDTWRNGLFVTAHRYGWYVEIDLSFFKAAGIPPAIRDVLGYAIAHDCFFVNLDADHPELPELPTYDWSTDERL